MHHLRHCPLRLVLRSPSLSSASTVSKRATQPTIETHNWEQLSIQIVCVPFQVTCVLCCSPLGFFCCYQFWKGITLSCPWNCTKGSTVWNPEIALFFSECPFSLFDLWLNLLKKKLKLSLPLDSKGSVVLNPEIFINFIEVFVRSFWFVGVVILKKKLSFSEMLSTNSLLFGYKESGDSQRFSWFQAFSSLTEMAGLHGLLLHLSSSTNGRVSLSDWNADFLVQLQSYVPLEYPPDFLVGCRHLDGF